MEISWLVYPGGNEFCTRNQSVVAVIKISYDGMKSLNQSRYLLFFSLN